MLFSLKFLLKRLAFLRIGYKIFYVRNLALMVLFSVMIYPWKVLHVLVAGGGAGAVLHGRAHFPVRSHRVSRVMPGESGNELRSDQPYACSSSATPK